MISKNQKPSRGSHIYIGRTLSYFCYVLKLIFSIVLLLILPYVLFCQVTIIASWIITTFTLAPPTNTIICTATRFIFLKITTVVLSFPFSRTFNGSPLFTVKDIQTLPWRIRAILKITSVCFSTLFHSCFLPTIHTMGLAKYLAFCSNSLQALLPTIHLTELSPVIMVLHPAQIKFPLRFFQMPQLEILSHIHVLPSHFLHTSVIAPISLPCMIVMGECIYFPIVL